MLCPDTRQAVPKQYTPLMWGRLERERSCGGHRRNIPADVGKTWQFNSAWMQNWKHPHGCGEDTLLLVAGVDGEETPPTDVGKPRGRSSCGTRRRKHPHKRGEDPRTSRTISLKKESHPRMWERSRGTDECAQTDGNTPTNVGKVPMFVFAFPTALETPPQIVGKDLRAGSRSSRSQKHSHGCGEGVEMMRLTISWKETPPHVWESRRNLQQCAEIVGKTPTDCGEGQSRNRQRAT